MNFIKTYRSFKYAFKGIAHLFRYENNAQIHLLFAVLSVVSGFLFKIERFEWMMIVISIFLVFSAEVFNTAIEQICDKFHPGFSTRIGKIKDLAAAGVLFVSISAFIIGLVIFVPKILDLF